MTNREQAIKRVAEAIGQTTDDVKFYMRPRMSSSNLATYAVDTTERVLELEAALRKLRDCDWVITLPDRMDAVREIARAALQPIGDRETLRADLAELHPYSHETVRAAVGWRDTRIKQLEAELARVTGLLNTPELHDFAKAVSLEAAHQRERWGEDHDAEKSSEDWFWNVGYLCGKALSANRYGDGEKAVHHLVTAAAFIANWHAHMLGKWANVRALATQKREG